jgi:RND family efflux transporter MFP subunit
MSFWKQAILSLVLVAAAAGGWYYYSHQSAGAPERQAAGAPNRNGGQGRGEGGGGNRIPGLIGGGAVNVVTAPVETDNAGDSVISLGTAKAARSVTLYPQVSGMVAEVLVVPGKTVRTGDLLVRLENDEEKVAVEKAQITLEQAQGTLERQQSLAKSKTISSVALSDAQTAVRMAGVELRSAEIDLGRRSITAPFSGVTGLTDLSVGDFVTTSTPLATVDDFSTMRVEFEVPERWAGRVAPGQAITATAQALPGSSFPGTITGIDNRVDQTTRTLRMQAELANDDGALKTGMAILVTLKFDTDKELAVPSLAVQWDRRGSFVWKVVDGAARRTDVAIVRRHSGVVVVRGEVQAGDRVIVEGLLRLREGAKVNEVNETPDIVDEAPPSAEGVTPAVSGTGAAARTRS